MRKKTKLKLYIAIGGLAIFFVIIAALFGAFEQNKQIIEGYGFLNEKGELERNITIYGDTEVNILSGAKRTVTEIRITSDVQVKSIEVLVRSKGVVDRSLGKSSDTTYATFKDSYEGESGNYLNAISICGVLNYDTGKYIPVSEIHGNYLVLIIKTNKDAKISIEMISEVLEE